MRIVQHKSGKEEREMKITKGDSEENSKPSTR